MLRVLKLFLINKRQRARPIVVEKAMQLGRKRINATLSNRQLSSRTSDFETTYQSAML